MRFPGFEGSWEFKRLSELGYFFSGGTPKTTNKNYYDGHISFIRSGEIKSDITELRISEDALKNSSAKMVYKGDILIAIYGATSGDIAISKISGAINQAILCFDTKVNNQFFKNLWQKHVEIILETYLQGGQGNLSAEIVKNLKFYFPMKVEQKKIALFFENIEEKIETQRKTIENLQSLKRSLLNKIFKRKNSFYKKTNWEEKQLAEISNEHQEKNLKNHYNEVFSVAKSKGVINQIEHLGRSFSASDVRNYKLIFPGDLVYTKSPTSDFPFGIIKQNRTNRIGVVSPLYCVFAPQNFALGYLLHEYFESSVNTFNYLNPLVQKGAKNTMNINNETFLNGAELFLPMDENEQNELYKLFLSINNKIKIEFQILEKLHQQKKFFLQNLFV